MGEVFPLLFTCKQHRSFKSERHLKEQGDQLSGARLNCELLVLAEEMGVACLSPVRTLELSQRIGVKCLCFPGRAAARNSPPSKGQTRPEVQKGNLSLESPPPTETFPPQTGEFPCDKSANKSGLAPMSWCSCANTWSGLMSQSQGHNPWEHCAHTGYCQGNQTHWAHNEFACKESGGLK